MIHGEGEIVCECDNCGNEERIEFDEGCHGYKEAQKELRSMGWVSRKIDGEWYDFLLPRVRRRILPKIQKKERMLNVY